MQTCHVTTSANCVQPKANYLQQLFCLTRHNSYN